MELLPSPEERTWLAQSLRDLIAKRGIDAFVAKPLLEPSPASFPDSWSRGVADVHRLTQRLMHHAELGDVAFTLSGFAGASSAWDANTAGWYAGIDDDGRCSFGVHMKQLRDPESAVGVMAHEVAHAWREHHGLVVDDRDQEEHLTDLTTIYLGFGILTTNNTDRYRSYGNARITAWSVSSAGYLPPQAMTWLLALQATARDRAKESRAIEKFLEPNQRACFDAAMHEMTIEPSYIHELGMPSPESWPPPQRYAPIEVREPDDDEVDEPPIEEEAPVDHQRNTGRTVYRLQVQSVFLALFLGLFPGGFVGAFVVLLLLSDASDFVMFGTWGAFILAGEVFVWRQMWKAQCSDKTCKTFLPRGVAICPGCGGTVGRTVRTLRDLRRVNEEELDRREVDTGFEECADCKPEEPCNKHAASMPIDAAFFRDATDDSDTAEA
jgi:hypothetical protein